MIQKKGPLIFSKFRTVFMFGNYVVLPKPGWLIDIHKEKYEMIGAMSLKERDTRMLIASLI